MGAWFGYGLGTENQNLPGFVVLNGGLIPPGGLDCFGSGFLPASYQGSVFLPQNEPVANIKPNEKSAELQKNKLSLLADLDKSSMEEMNFDPQVVLNRSQAWLVEVGPLHHLEHFSDN